MYFVSDKQIQKIKDTIIGVNIVLGDMDFGNVVDIESEIVDSNTSLFAITDTGHCFNAFEVYQLYRSVYDKVADKVYPEGSAYSHWNVGPKSGGWNGGGAINAANIPTNARIGNETVNISRKPG